MIRIVSFGLSRWEGRRLHRGACSKGMVMLTTPCVDFYYVCCFPHSVRPKRLSETDLGIQGALLPVAGVLSSYGSVVRCYENNRFPGVLIG